MTKAVPRSSWLSFLYGNDYEKVLGSGCVNLSNDSSKKQALRILALILPLINLVMHFTYRPFETTYTKFTSWAMLSSNVVAFYINYASSFGQEIDKHKKTLARIHLWFEFAVALNIVVVPVYWGMLHAKEIVLVEGGEKVHLYFVHIFPAVSMFLAMLSAESLYLIVSHYLLLIPVPFVYGWVNYRQFMASG